MTTAPEAFLDRIRLSQKFVAAVAKYPALVEHLDAVQYAIDKADELSVDDAVWVERLDEIRAIVGRGDTTTKQKLMAMGRAFETWRPKRH